MRNRLTPFRYRVVFPSGKHQGSAIHVFYAPNKATADRYAKAWARRRHATKITRIRKESHGK
jgi:hypothetical protein